MQCNAMPFVPAVQPKGSPSPQSLANNTIHKYIYIPHLDAACSIYNQARAGRLGFPTPL
jgi:hypothetical protein